MNAVQPHPFGDHFSGFGSLRGTPGGKLGGGREDAAAAVVRTTQASLSQDGFLDDMASGANAPSAFTRDFVNEPLVIAPGKLVAAPNP